MNRIFSWAVVVLIGLVALAAITLWITLDPGPSEPNQAQWKEAASVIADEFKPGDGIRVHPFWLVDSAAVLSGISNEGYRPGIIDLTLPPDPMFVARHKRLWVVSALGRSDIPAPSGLEHSFQKQSDGLIEIRRYNIPPLTGFVDLMTLLPKATVVRYGGRSKKRACHWNGSMHNCNGRNWENIKIEHKHVGGSPRRCIVLHPYPNRATVALTFPSVKLAGGLLFRAGFTLEAARRDEGSDTSLKITLNDAVVHERVEPKNSWRWKSVWIDTTDQRGKNGVITFEVSAEKEAWRELCIDGYVLPARPASLQR